MEDFGNAAFPPDMIALMQRALESAVATLPEPVSSSHIRSIAESILRTAKEGVRDPTALQTMALLELNLAVR